MIWWKEALEVAGVSRASIVGFLFAEIYLGVTVHDRRPAPPAQFPANQPERWLIFVRHRLRLASLCFKGPMVKGVSKEWRRASGPQ